MDTMMHERMDNAVPLWQRIVAGTGVIWYAFGLYQFWLGFSMDTPEAVSAGIITPAHAAAIEGTPFLIWLAFAMASGTGLAGAVLLFKGSAFAKTAFAVSLVSAAIYYGWIYFLSDNGAGRPFEETIIAMVVGTVTLFFFLLSAHKSRANT